MSRKPRIERLERTQGVIRFEIPEDGLPPDHPARLLWSVLGSFDLSAFLVNARALEGGAGRSTKSPRMMLALWCYAISRGIGSAREIERLTEQDLAFRWITGERSISRQTLSNFRAKHSEAMEKLFTDVVGVLLNKGLLSLDTVAVDGMRVRASASAPSFRRCEALEQAKEQAALHLKAVLAQTDDPELSAKQKSVRIQKAREFQKRVDDALAVLEQMEAQKRPPKSLRASTTDAEARVMKMADGGFRPGFNVQLATAGDVTSGVRTVVAVRVTNVGSDMQSLEPMVQQLADRAGRLPGRVLADANHANFAHVEALERRGVEVYVPPNKTTKTRTERSDTLVSEEVHRWTRRMDTPEAEELYRARASLCELSNAHFRSRYGMQQFLVRGLRKATAVALLTAVTHNVLSHASKLLA
jgi:transposase